MFPPTYSTNMFVQNKVFLHSVSFSLQLPPSQMLAFYTREPKIKNVYCHDVLSPILWGEMVLIWRSPWSFSFLRKRTISKCLAFWFIMNISVSSGWYVVISCVPIMCSNTQIAKSIAPLSPSVKKQLLQFYYLFKNQVVLVWMLAYLST